MKRMKLKKSALLLVMLLVLCTVSVGCGEKEGPSGTYTVGDKLTYMEFVDDRVTLQMGQASAVGSWKLKGDKLTLIYDNNAGEKEYTYDAEKDEIVAPSGEVLTRIAN